MKMRRQTRKIAGCCGLVLGLLIPVTPPDPAWSQTRSVAAIKGKIVDAKNQPMEYVNVQILGTLDGDVTDRNGRFTFNTHQFGTQKLRASMMGFEPVIKPLVVAAGDTVVVHLHMHETLVMLGEAVVTASAFSTGDEKGVTLRGLEVVTTPGAAADIFLAIKSFPGVAMVDEGSGLFVRGGDVTETVTLLDQATVVHPYKYESPTGGVFGTIPPFLVRGTFFSAGAFSARYGNALSGILAMESQGMPERVEYQVGVGLAAASAGLQTTVANNKLGIRFSGNRSSTDIMFRLNGRHDEFTLTPRSLDGNLSLILRYSETGTLKFFNYGAHDRIGVRVDQPSFVGTYTGDENNRLHNLQLTDLFRGWLVKASISLNRYSSGHDLGNLALDQRDDTYKLRVDFEKALRKRLHFYTGLESERARNTFTGEVPFYRSVLDPQAQTYTLDEQFATTRHGGYIETETQLGRRWFANLGIRADYHLATSRNHQATASPRLAFRYQLSKANNLRFSWGRYQQFPGPYLFNPVTGNPNLRAQEAQHLVATFEHNRGNTLIRVEGYRKLYRRLIIADNATHYRNNGDGEASGIDLFLKYGAFLQTRFNGWISYSYLHSRRLQARDHAGTYTFEKAPSPYDITHNLTIVGKTNVYRYLTVGLTYRYATGRPTTPIVGAIQQAPLAYYLPIEGPVSSERLPAFQRLDASMSYYCPFGGGHAAIFYLAVSNLLNRSNVLDYEYSADYSTRTPRTTNYRRFYYFGVSLSLLGNR